MNPKRPPESKRSPGMTQNEKGRRQNQPEERIPSTEEERRRRGMDIENQDEGELEPANTGRGKERRGEEDRDQG